MSEAWYHDAFKDQNAEQIVKTIGKYDKENMEIKVKLPKGSPPDDVLEALTFEVKKVAAHSKLFEALGCPALMDRHWKKINNLLNAEGGSLPVGLDSGTTF